MEELRDAVDEERPVTKDLPGDQQQDDRQSREQPAYEPGADSVRNPGRFTKVDWPVSQAESHQPRQATCDEETQEPFRGKHQRRCSRRIWKETGEGKERDHEK